MTEQDNSGTATLPPSGWYADPGSTTHLRYWDGSTWTGYVHARASAGRRPVGTGWYNLATWAQSCLWGIVVLDVVRLVARWNALGHFAAWKEDEASYDYATAVSIDEWDLITSVGQLLLMTATGVLVIVWLYRACRSDRVYAGDLSWKPAWAIWGWLVPIVHLFVPFRLVSDVRRVALRDAGLPRDTGAALVGWWWALFIASNFAANAGLRLMIAGWGETPTFEQLQLLATVEVVEMVVDVPAAILAVLVLKRISDWWRLGAARRSGQGSVRPS